MGKSLAVAASKKAVTLSEAKRHLRIEDSEEDVLLSLYITTATAHIEKYLSRALITQSWDYFINEFSDTIKIPLPPLQSVTSIKYIDTNGAEQTLSDTVYDVDTSIDPGIIRLAYDQAWPSIRSTHNAVTIRFVAGYGDSESNIDAPIKQAALLLIGHLYENRELSAPITIKEVPFAFESLLAQYQWSFF